MNSNVNEAEPNIEENDYDGELEETTVLPDAELTDNVGDVSVEINVEQLVAEIESEKNADAARKKEIRRRLEELTEDKSFEDTYALEYDADN